VLREFSRPSDQPVKRGDPEAARVELRFRASQLQTALPDASVLKLRFFGGFGPKAQQFT
jgi:hypothetical protein